MQRVILPTMMLLLLLAGAGMSFAGPFGPGPEGFGPGKKDGGGRSANCGKGEADDRQLTRLTVLLKLNEEQQGKIGAILATEEEKAAPLLAQMAENRDQLHRAIHSGAADEEAIRTLAAAQGKIKADLLVMRAQSWRQIHGALTPEQQEIAKNAPPGFRPERGRPGPGRDGRGGHRD
jgi:Spy/CpxP family protein refolding chaperone